MMAGWWRGVERLDDRGAHALGYMRLLLAASTIQGMKVSLTYGRELIGGD
jgi:hypothetical protein